MSTKTSSTAVAHIIVGGDEMGARMRELDWTEVAIGPPEGWTPSFRSALSICIGSRFPIALYWGRELTLVYNDAWSPILGTKHPWALGRPAKDVWPEIWDAIGPLFEQVVATGESVYQEDGILLMHRHGYTEECYFNFTFTPVRGDDGKIEGIFNAVNETTFRFISERRARVLRELAEHAVVADSVEDALDTAIDTLGAALHDVTFCAIYLHDEASGSLRLAAATAGLGDRPELPDEVTSFDPLPWPFVAARRSGNVEIANGLESLSDPLPGGVWPEPTRSALVAPLRTGPVASSWGYLIVGASPRRAVDDEYKQFVERAAGTIARVIVNVTAIQAERRRTDQLVELDRAKTAFFSNISHEFRTPLTLMLGPTEEALRSADPTLGGEALATVHRNQLRLLKLVNTLLEFARIEAGRARASFQPTDLAALTLDLASVFRSAVERAGIELVLECPPLPEPVYVDRDMWEKIVLNLLSNALKFTFDGSITVSLQWLGDRVALAVRDTGTGVPEAEVPHLFERFHRVADARSRSHEGTGIGLALVQDLAHLHGGVASVTSTVDVGSTFTVVIPTGSAHLPADQVSGARSLEHHVRGATAYVDEALRWMPEAEASEPRPGPRGAWRVLVADDNADMRAYLARLLAPLGSVETVGDGAQALAALRERRPDLIVTDVMMPGLDGFELTRAIRADQLLADLPVLMLSARAGEEATAEGLASGATDYLVKPFSAGELTARATSALALSSLRREVVHAQERAQQILEDVPVAIAVWREPEHVFEVANAHFQQVFGAREMVGRTVREVFPDTAIALLCDQVYTTGEPFRAPEFPVGAGFFALTMTPHRTPGGEILGVAAVAVEVTELVLGRRAVEELRERAESANRAKDEFLAMLGHELRNPMAPILTALELMKLRGSQGIEKERTVIERQIDHLVRLVDDLLDVSRITGGKVELRRSRIELAVVVANALEQASPLLEQRRHAVSVQVPRTGLTVDGDPIRLAQVIGNLLVNAAKYTEPGGSVTVTGERDGPFVVLRVKDSGIGISAELLPHVFDLFTQEHQAIDRARGGLGLGLAIVRSLVTMHGGIVTAASEGRGHGTEITVLLPWIAPERADAPTRPTPQVGSKVQRVLIVDDNEDAAGLLAELLQRLGHTTMVALDGPSALRLADEFKPEVALLDIGLPVMDGYELARQLRGHPRLSSIRLIALTGYGLESDRQRSTDAGFDQHMVKPIQLEALASILASRGR